MRKKRKKQVATNKWVVSYKYIKKAFEKIIDNFFWNISSSLKDNDLKGEINGTNKPKMDGGIQAQ